MGFLPNGASLIQINKQRMHWSYIDLEAECSVKEAIMITPVNVPEFTILPSEVPSGEPGKCLYAWKMKLHEESTLDSEDHGDDFDSVQEALAHAYTVFEDLVNTRQLYPSNVEQEFKVTIKKG